RFFDAVTLPASVVATSAGIEIDGTLDCAYAGAGGFTANGATTLGGVVGGTYALASLFVTGGTHLRADSVTTNGAQSYGGPLILSALATTLSTGGFAITFNDAIKRVDGGPFSLTTATHTGIDFAGGTCDFVLAGTTPGTEYTQIVSDAAV